MYYVYDLSTARLGVPETRLTSKDHPSERRMTFVLLAPLRRTGMGLVKVMGTLMWTFR